MKILTFDTEEWFIEKYYKDGLEWKYKAYDEMLGRILNLLDRHSLKATFFCVGRLADDFAHVVKRIADAGHEIGCHSHAHQWINKMSEAEFREDTRTAIDRLQQCSGRAVRSYRAPAFSIGEVNKWAFRVLAECGIENDASIFPGMRDFGGFPSFSESSHPCRISYEGCTLNEFPITMGQLPIINRPIAYSGGGYFRLLPLSFIKHQMERNDYVMCYFHILDLLDFKSQMLSKADYERYFHEPGTLKNRAMRYLKSNIGRKRTFSSISTLLDTYDFISVEAAARQSASFPTITI